MKNKTICGIVYNDSGKILLGTKNSWNNAWGFLGGSPESYDNSEIDTFFREVLEESGIPIIKIRKLEDRKVKLDINNKMTNFDISFYLGKAIYDNITPNSEMSEIKWVYPIDALGSYRLFQPVREILEKYVLKK